MFRQNSRKPTDDRLWITSRLRKYVIEEKCGGKELQRCFREKLNPSGRNLKSGAKMGAVYLIRCITIVVHIYLPVGIDF